MDDDDYVKLRFDRFKHETDLARLYKNEDDPEDYWFPKSQHDWDEDETENVTIWVRAWFAEKEGHV